MEKPIALTLADADRIIAKSEQTGTPLHVGYAQRFKRRYLSAKDQILEGRLGEITALTGRHLASSGVWMAMKGRRPDDEIATLPETVDVFHVEQLQVPGLDAQRCIVWMRPGPGPVA